MYQHASSKLINSINNVNPDIWKHQDKFPQVDIQKQMILSASDIAPQVLEECINNPEFRQAIGNATPEDLVSFLDFKEGQIKQAEESRNYQEQLEFNQRSNDIHNKINNLLSGRVDTLDYNSVLRNEGAMKSILSLDSAPELITYLHDHQEITDKLYKLDQSMAMYELGKLEERAKLYTQSANFKKKYPAKKDFRADESYQGSGTMPQGLHEGLSDAEWNKRFNKIKNRR